MTNQQLDSLTVGSIPTERERLARLIADYWSKDSEPRVFDYECADAVLADGWVREGAPRTPVPELKP